MPTVGTLLCDDLTGGLLCADDGTLLFFNGDDCECCCLTCGSCKFNQNTRVTVTWSFTIADAALDLNGSGQAWSDVPNPIPTEFGYVASGSVTLTPADLTGIGTGGTSGRTAWTITLTLPDASTAQLSVFYDCASDKWGWNIAGPGTGMWLSHDDNTVEATHALGLITGSCSSASASTAIFTLTGGGAEFSASGSLSISVDNPCMAA